MARQMIGTVSALWRYPVKSMRGERLDQAEITERGAAGDRAWALREIATGHIASAKKFPRLFEFRAAYDSPPAPVATALAMTAPVTIELPDGRKIHAEDADASEVVSAAIGRKLRLERAQPARTEIAGVDPATLFAGVPVEKIFPGATAATMPDGFPLKQGSFFDSAVIQVLASGTLRHLAKLAPGSIFDPRRFRPTILVDTGDRGDGFIEDQWEDATLGAGADVKIVAMRPALRCVMTTHPQEELPRDHAILRTAALHHRANVGVFAAVGAPGVVRVGDPVWLDK